MKPSCIFNELKKNQSFRKVDRKPPTQRFNQEDRRKAWHLEADYTIAENLRISTATIET